MIFGVKSDWWWHWRLASRQFRFLLLLELLSAQNAHFTGQPQLVSVVSVRNVSTTKLEVPSSSSNRDASGEFASKSV